MSTAMITQSRSVFQFVVAVAMMLTAGNALWAITPHPNETENQVEIGTPVQAFELSDFRGKLWTSRELLGDQCTVVAFLGVECPLAKLYTKRLIELSEQFAGQPVTWIAIDSNVQDSLQEMSAHARRYGWDYTFLKDPDATVAHAFGATRTPEVCVLDSSGVLRYRGKIDDQFGIGVVRDLAKATYLKDAVTSVLAGRDVAVNEVPAEGCVIGQKRNLDESCEVTFSDQIARILNNRCVECHRDGEIGPMDLTQYDEVAGWSEMILEVVEERRMPPWHADPAHGQFENDRSLTREEIDLIKRWVKAGAPQGNPDDLPQPNTYITGWQLPRAPDLVVDVSPEPFVVPPDGDVRYQYFRVDPDLTEDKWIAAAELKPGNRAVVHHILAFAREKGSRGGFEGERGFLVGYVPGTRVAPFPDGMAKKLPANSELVFQVHYTPIGTEELDQSQLGLVFADPASVTHELQVTSCVQPRLRIPPGDPNYEVSAMLPEELPDCQLVSMSPHMHLRGKAFKYTAIYPDDTRETLLDIPAYDFNWQTEYRLQDFKTFPKGTRVFCEASFDNSEDNLNNPAPDEWVRWGDQTYEEMMIGYFLVAIELDDQGKSESVRGSRGARLRGMTINAIFQRLDVNKDQQLTDDEIPDRLKQGVKRLDKNKDGVLQLSELPKNG